MPTCHMFFNEKRKNYSFLINFSFFILELCPERNLFWVFVTFSFENFIYSN